MVHRILRNSMQTLLSLAAVRLHLQYICLLYTSFDITKLPHPDYEKVYVGDGDTIELGNRTIEILDVKPAHCNSCLLYTSRCV